VLEPDFIGIARVLHDRMDLPTHATDDFGEG
jgi:plasmid stabilization system protein ParE